MKNIANIFISFVIRIVRGRSVSTFGGVSTSTALIYVIQRGLIPFLRGFICKPLLCRSSGLLFIGAGVRLLTPKLLSVGKNVYIGDYCHFNCYSTGGVNLGDQVTIREFGWVQLTSHLEDPGGSINIGSQTYIGPRVILGAAADLRIGSKCQIGANVSFVAESHKFDSGSEIFEQGVTRKGIVVGNDCWIGNNVTILDGVSVGDGAVIGAGSVVIHDIPSYSVAVGVPARIIKNR